MVRHREKTADYKSRREAAGRTNPFDSLISDFRPPELSENSCLLSKPLTPCCVVVAAQSKTPSHWAQQRALLPNKGVPERAGGPLTPSHFSQGLDTSMVRKFLTLSFH